MKTNISYKIFFKNYGIVVAYLVIIFGILIYFSKISQKSWQKNLKTTTQTVLNEYFDNEWTVGNPVRIKNALSQSSACFETYNKKNGEMYKSIIIRIQTMYGPLPAVFIVDKENNVTFAGYSSVHGRVQNQLNNNNNNKRILYWKQKIPEILK